MPGEYTSSISAILLLILLKLIHQSIPAAPNRPPPPPPAPITIFFALDGKSLGVGSLELSNPPGWGQKKRANAPSSVNTATFFIDCTVEKCRFKHFDVRFFVSSNIFLCNSARTLIKTPQRHVPVSGYNIDIKLLTLELIERCKVMCDE